MERKWLSNRQIQMRYILVFLMITALSACTQLATPNEIRNAFDKRAKQLHSDWSKPDTLKQWREDFQLLDHSVHVPRDWPHPIYTEKQPLSGSFALETSLGATHPQETVDLSEAITAVPVWDASSAYAGLISPDGSATCKNSPSPKSTPSNGDSTTTPQCGDTFVITDIQPNTAAWFTNAGMVELPTWEYTVSGFDEPIVQVAFDAQADQMPPRLAKPSDEIPAGMVSATALESATDHALTYDAETCATDPRPLVYETDDLIVLGARVMQQPSCSQLNHESVKITLDDEIGSRNVVDAITGRMLRFGMVYPA